MSTGSEFQSGTTRLAKKNFLVFNLAMGIATNDFSRSFSQAGKSFKKVAKSRRKVVGRSCVHRPTVKRLFLEVSATMGEIYINTYF